MTLARAINAWTAPISQVIRFHDGIRGIIAKHHFNKGDLLISIPISFSYFPHASKDMKRLRRWNRSLLLPEMQEWLKRLSFDIQSIPVSLTSSVSIDNNNNNNVITLVLSPVEAALSISIALRYFWNKIVPIKNRETQSKTGLGPVKYNVADLYINALPIKDYLSYGLEGAYFSSLEEEANLHSSIEQLSWNLRDCILSYASQDEYKFYDYYASELDAVILASIYVIRARLIHITVIWGNNNKLDNKTSIIAPIIDMLNHNSDNFSCAACVSIPKRAIIVRAARDINIGEELTLNYHGSIKHKIGKLNNYKKNNDHHNISSYSNDDENWWESRYLFSENNL